MSCSIHVPGQLQWAKAKSDRPRRPVPLPSLGDSHVPDDVVQADVAAGLHALRGEQEGHARLALHDVTPLAQHQTLGAEATLVVE